MNRSCAPHWIVRLGSPSRCPDLVVVSPDFRRITHPDRVDHCDSFPTFYGSHLSAVELCQPLARSAQPCPCLPGVVERTDTVSCEVQDVVASAGFSVAFLRSVQAQAPLLSATVAAMGTPFRSPIPLPKRAPPQHASEPARGSVPPGLCDPLLKAVSGSLPPRLQLSLHSRPVGPWWRSDISQLSCRAHVHLDFTRSSSSHWPHQLRHRCL